MSNPFSTLPRPAGAGNTLKTLTNKDLHEILDNHTTAIHEMREVVDHNATLSERRGRIVAAWGQAKDRQISHLFAIAATEGVALLLLFLWVILSA